MYYLLSSGIYCIFGNLIRIHAVAVINCLYSVSDATELLITVLFMKHHADTGLRSHIIFTTRLNL